VIEEVSHPHVKICSGEIDYAYMMRVLGQLNYKGYFDTEMGTSTTPEAAMQLARNMSLENWSPVAFMNWLA